MIVECFLMCDGALEQSGKMSLVGTFDEIITKKVPITVRLCVLAIRVRFGGDEALRHKIEVCAFSPDGKMLAQPRLEGIMVMRPVPPWRDSVTANLVLGSRPLKFREFGKYKFRLKIDGENAAELPLYVRKE